MQKKVGRSGNSGPKIRSDCEVIIEKRESGGITVDLESKVLPLFGKSIESQCRELMQYFRISGALITIKDSGALPFVISARIEAAVRQIKEDIDEYLPDMSEKNLYDTDRNRSRLSRLYLPGNTPGLMINAGLHEADGIILDLEDSVAPGRKDEARLLVRNVLRVVDFYGAERMVRINQGKRGIEDLKFTVPHHVNLILIPKCESAEEVRIIDKEISVIREEHKISNPVYLMPIIESARGVENAFEIAGSSGNVVAVAIGLEDYTADIGVTRSDEGLESLYARTRLVNAANAAGVQPIDSVFSDVADAEGLRRTVRLSKSIGFAGMGCIHPRQVRIIREGYSPDNEEIEKAMKIVIAFREASEKGLGVVALGSKMIDPPVVARAQKTIELAIKLGLLSAYWLKEQAGNSV